MYFIQNYLYSILYGSILGSLFGIIFIKISKLSDEFRRFKSLDFKFLYDDVKKLNREKYNKVSREELMSQVHYLCQRMLVIETKMEEREKDKSRL